MAVLYGADAVYLGGENFGLRSASENFSQWELRQGVAFAHAHGVKVYLVLNGFLHDGDLASLPDFLHFLKDIEVDGVIVSDLGVIKTVREHSSLPIHLSTQASCLNAQAARWWKRAGVQRIVLGREVSLQEAGKIGREVGIELEMFVHGSLCSSYSGHCVISNYTQGRDSNRGGCAHSCRFEYRLELDPHGPRERSVEDTFMSSKDLQGLGLLQEFVRAGVSSLKVEGRMKSHHYVGTVIKVYRQALDFYSRHGHFSSPELTHWQGELDKVPHRDYCTGSLAGPAGAESIFSQGEEENRPYQMGGVVLQAVPGKHLLLEVRSPFSPGDQLELLPFKGRAQSFRLSQLSNVEGCPLERCHPGGLVKIPYCPQAQSLNLVRVYRKN